MFPPQSTRFDRVFSVSPNVVPNGDAPIRSTDNDAAIARLSAVQKQYLKDPYVKYLVPRAHLVPARPPLINVGTYVRTRGIDDLVYQWLKLAKDTGSQVQIISLGAGSDTRFWRIAARNGLSGTCLGRQANVFQEGEYKDTIRSYVEVDFEEITTKKAMAIRKHKELMGPLGDPTQVRLAQGGMALHSPKYHLLPADLRKPATECLNPILHSAAPPFQTPIIDPSVPTLLLFECVLAYMSSESSSSLLSWFVSEAKSVLGCIVYEMFGLNDAFGRVMLSNLKQRNIAIPGIEPYPDEASLTRRFTTTGFTAARALTLKDIRRSYIEPEELERISKVEFLDEIEELELVLAHYAISWGLYVTGSEAVKDWGSWGLRQKVDSQ